MQDYVSIRKKSISYRIYCFCTIYSFFKSIWNKRINRETLQIDFSFYDNIVVFCSMLSESVFVENFKSVEI